MGTVCRDCQTGVSRNDKKQMIHLFQYYRIAAAFLILLIHQQFWMMPLALGRLTGVAVPLFAAMAGFLFAKTLSGDFDLRAILAKKSRRIIIPYVIWAVVYWVANGVILDGIIKHEAVVVPTLRSWLLGGTACHLWFLPCLFMAFVLVACCRWLARRMSFNVAWPVSVVLMASAMTQFIPDETSATMNGYIRIYFGRLLFYFAVGFLIAMLNGFHSISTCIIGWGLMLIGCGNVIMNWIPGLVWSPLLLVVGLILFAKAKPKVVLPQWIGKLADASMGIYLVHVLFTSGANSAVSKVSHSLLQAPFGFVLSVALFVASYITVKLLPKKCF